MLFGSANFTYTLRVILCAISLVMPWAAGASVDLSHCFSCRIEVNSLDSALNISGQWLFTRDDHPDNAQPQADTSHWVTVHAPGPWAPAYNDGKLFTTGWYRGNFHFGPAMLGKKVIFYMDAYMSPIQVHLDGKLLYQREGQNSHEKYYSVQPIPMEFTVTQAEHVIAIRVHTPLMAGIYQLPFQLRPSVKSDFTMNFFQILGGEVRYVAAYIIAWSGLFFLLLYWKTRYSLYLIAGLTGIGIYPFYAFPNDISVKLFSPWNLLMLHYLGIGFMAYGHMAFSQHFYIRTPRLNRIYLTGIGILSLGFVVMTFAFNERAFLILRKSQFLWGFIISNHLLYNLIRALPKNRSLWPLALGEIVFWLASVHDILLAIGIIQSTSMIFIGTLVATTAVLVVTANIFAETFLQNRKLLKEVEIHNANLEKTVADRTQDLREQARKVKNLLNTIDQGIFSFNRDLAVNEEHSARAQDLFRHAKFGEGTLVDVLGFDERKAQEFKDWVDLMSKPQQLKRWKRYQELAPIRELRRNHEGQQQILSFEYQPIMDGDQLASVMVLAKDVSAQKLAEEKLKEEQQKHAAQMERVLACVNNEPSDLIEFFKEVDTFLRKVKPLNTEQALHYEVTELFRLAHTIKGTGGSLGFGYLAKICGETEDVLERVRDPNRFADEDANWFQAWPRAIERAEAELLEARAFFTTLHSQGEDTLSIKKLNFQEILARLQTSHPVAFQMVRDLNRATLVDLSKRYQNVIRSYRETTGKLIEDLHFVNGEALVHRDVMSIFDLGLIHLIRNACDHGIESTEERRRLEKGPGQVSIRYEEDEESFTIAVMDNGKGVDAKAVAESAIVRGFISRERVNSLSDEEKIQLIFLSGLSTRDQVTETSGRGVGMDVVKATIEGYGGRVIVGSVPGRGTTIKMTLPRNVLDKSSNAQKLVLTA